MKATLLKSFVLVSFAGAAVLPGTLVEYPQCCLDENNLPTFEHCAQWPESIGRAPCCKPSVSDIKPADFTTVQASKFDSHELVAVLPQAPRVCLSSETVMLQAALPGTSPPYFQDLLALHSRRNE